MPHRRPLLFALACLALLLLARPAAAQIGGTTDIITGTVIGPGDAPIAGAHVDVTSVETGITRTKTTNDKGAFTLLFPDGGGQYQVVVRALGMAPRQLTLTRQADEDRLVANVTLSPTATQLATVNVRARRPTARPDERPTPGSTGRTLSGEQLQRLPVDPSDPNAIALLAPGVVAVGGSDTTAAGFSVAGQRPDQNDVTLDGLSAGATSVPQEAIRNARVVTSTYDVARGQFTGGIVQTTTRGGTNDVAGSASYSLRDPHLEWATDDGNTSTAFTQAYTQQQLSGGVGGPIVKNKLFYFGSAQLRRRTNPLQSLLALDPATLRRLGASPDSAQRFLDLLNDYGLPATAGGVPDDRLTDNGSAVARVDWQVGEDHSLMLRGNWQGSLQRGARTSALAVPAFGGEQTTNGGGAMLSLSSVLGTFLNEARASATRTDNVGDPYVELPDGRVRISSFVDDTTLSVSTLQFGGNPGLPTAGRTDRLQATDELSWLGVPGHRLKLGALVDYSTFSTASSTNRFGSFTYNSLEDFANNAPSSFTRTLTPRLRAGDAVNSALYAGDVWRRSRTFQLTYGVRLEHSAFLREPAYNPLVESLFGLRTDRLPSELHLSPRAGFTWTVGGGNVADAAAARGGGRGGRGGGGGGGGGRGGRRAFSDVGAGPTGVILRGGVGEFRGVAPVQLFASALDATGLPGDEQQLVCIGAAVPTPNWPAYALDPSSVPTACADGGTGQPAPGANQRPNVALFDPDFGAPRAWRASLGAARRVGARYGVNVDASYALGTNLYGARDLNVVRSPQFTLASEGNRPVYVPASSIVPGTGAVSVLESRLHPELAQVVEATSNLHSRTGQLTVGVTGVSLTNLVWNLNYTLTRSLDETSFAPSGGRAVGGGGGFGAFGFGVGSSTTGGDPNAVEWGTSDLERRHALSGSTSWFVKPWLDLTSVIRLSSGTPYTPRVGSDVNGDGSRNDRAFVFDPAVAPDTALANGMTRLLARAPGNVRDCLASQLGRIADRNSCRGAWTPTLDLQANVRPWLGPTLQRRLAFMISFVNPLAGVDQLLHGSRDLRGWGQPSRPDPTLLYVRGFDPGTQRFVYQVNERFGDTRASRTALLNPFQIGVQARLQIGPDRQRELMMARIGAMTGRGGGPGGAGGLFDARTMVDRVAPNVAAIVLGYRDTLKLTDAQVATLTALDDSMTARTDSLVTALEGIAAKATQDVAAGGDPASIFRTLQPQLQAARSSYLASVERVRGVLTPEQWALLPEEVRNPPAARGGAGRPRRERP